LTKTQSGGVGNDTPIRAKNKSFQVDFDHRARSLSIPTASGEAVVRHALRLQNELFAE
jgi:hypothetical protein